MIKKVKNKKKNQRNNVLIKHLLKIKNKESVKLLIIIISSISLLILISAFLIKYIETINNNDSINTFTDAIWWSIVTITTVGYGDIVPHSFAGKIAGIIIILIGYSLFSLFTGLISSIFVEERLKGAQGLKPLNNHNHIVFLGWNKTAENMLEVFQKQFEKIPTIAIVDKLPGDFFQDLKSHFHDIDLKYVRGDLFQEEIMKRANVVQAQLVYVFPSDFISKEIADDRSTIAASTVRYLSNDIPLIVQLLQPANRKHLEQIGVNYVFIFEEMGGYLLANSAQNHNFSQVHNEFLKSKNSEIKIISIPTQFIGAKYKELIMFFFEKDILPIGIFSGKNKLSVNDIFSDDSSGIDEFIKTMLDKTSTNFQESKDSVLLKPNNDYIINKRDKAIILETIND